MAQSNTAQAVLHADVPCPGCGCLCDDLTIEIADNQLVSLQPDCPLAATYFEQKSITAADCQIDGKSATLETAIEAAAKMIQSAETPLFFGLGETTSETVRRVIDLADRAGGIVDAAHPSFFDPSGRIVQTTGMVTCSLGEIRHRADLVIFWGCDPQTTHPRHWQRYSVEATGRFVPEGRKGRHLVGIGKQNATTDACDQFISLDPTQQIAALHHLLTLALGKPSDAAKLKEQLGEAASSLADLHQRIETSKYFVVVLGDGFLRRELGRVPLELLAQYVRPLHEKTRGAVSILKPGPNWVGAGGVVASRTGYPGAAFLTQGKPQFDPDNLSAIKLLAQKRVDAAMLWEGPWLDQLPTKAKETLAQIPTVVLGHRPLSIDWTPGVFLPVARPGLSDDGTMSRMDDMPLPVRAISNSDAAPALQIVDAILKEMMA
ncbi:hypothetical protein GC197_08275 [bacterium]|nr:hypothetical protein [bacterium]